MLPERKPICMIFLVAVDEYDTQVMCPSIKDYKSEKGRVMYFIRRLFTKTVRGIV